LRLRCFSRKNSTKTMTGVRDRLAGDGTT
jgi:hypothetical protein